MSPTQGSAPAWWPERQAFLNDAPDPAGLRRLAGEVMPGGLVAVVGPLAGGMESAVHAVELIDRHGRVRPAVLKRRQTTVVDGSAEWAALGACSAAAVPTPEPIAFDPGGRWFGAPALLMSRLRGHGLLDAGRDDQALRSLAFALAAIHDCDGAGLDEGTPRWGRGAPGDASPFERTVWDRIASLRPETVRPSALVHGDFHPGNALWQRSRLSGVIDWENGARGWPGEDVAKCRWYLTLLHGPQAARTFLRSYEAEVGRPVEHLALCDVSYAVGIPRWADRRAFFLGRSGFPAITPETICTTTRAFIEEALGVEVDGRLN